MRLGKVRALAKYIWHHKQAIFVGIILLEIIGIVGMTGLSTSLENGPLAEDYQRYMVNHDAVITELNRIELAQQEDLKPMQVLSSILMVMPEQVKCRHITVGNIHNGDWIILELETVDRNQLERYLSSLRRRPNFGTMRVEDLKDGARITVPMSEGVLW